MQVIGLLRRAPLTVEELGTALGVTKNAVRSQLASLERDGIVRQHGLRRGGGKPAYSYTLKAEFEPVLSRAYIPMLVRLLRHLAERLPQDQLAELMREVGRGWAGELPTLAGEPHAKAARASDLLNELGGVTEVEEDGRCWLIRGYSCPLALAVRENNHVCGAIQTLLERYTGEPVVERCERGNEHVRCRFEIGG